MTLISQSKGMRTKRNSTRITFGISLPAENIEFDNVIEVARLCERLGYDSLWCYDHMFPYDGADTTRPFYECLTTLSALSMVTENIRLGSLVLCNCFRNPALLAKVSSQIDVMSKGRLEFGIGAGWFEDEFDAYGYDFADGETRLAQLEEGIQVIKKMWTETTPSFEGKYYKIRKAVNEPKPVQKPHPPIWIGGSLNRILSLVARYANGWNLGFYQSNNPDKLARKNQILDDLCLKQGRVPSEVRRSWQGLLILGKNDSDLSRKTKEYMHLSMGIPPILATLDSCERELRKFTNADVTDFFIRFGDVLDSSTLEMFARQVIPLFKSTEHRPSNSSRIS